MLGGDLYLCSVGIRVWMTHVLIRASQSFVTGRSPSVPGVSSAADGTLRGTPPPGGLIGAAEPVLAHGQLPPNGLVSKARGSVLSPNAWANSPETDQQVESSLWGIPGLCLICSVWSISTSQVRDPF